MREIAYGRRSVGVGNRRRANGRERVSTTFFALQAKGLYERARTSDLFLLPQAQDVLVVLQRVGVRRLSMTTDDLMNELLQLRASLTAVSAEKEQALETNKWYEKRCLWYQTEIGKLAAEFVDGKLVRERELEKSLAEVSAERDRARIYEADQLMRAEKAELRVADVSRRLAQVTTYAQHLPNCELGTPGIRRTAEPLCTCGFNELALSVPTKEESGAGSRPRRADQETK